MKNEPLSWTKQTLAYANLHDMEISDERAFSVYFAFFCLVESAKMGKEPVIEFERRVFWEADFEEFFTGRERLDLLLHIGGKRIGFEFKYPKAADQQSTKKRAEIYQAIGRLVHLTARGIIDDGFLICATNNEAIYSGSEGLYPTYDGYSIPGHTYILPSRPAGQVVSHHSYGRIWNCMTANGIGFRWNALQGQAYHYLDPIEIQPV